MEKPIFNDIFSSAFNITKRQESPNYNFPDNVFGVFISVERSPRDSLSVWPEDIHGCIGYWNPDYSKMDDNSLISNIKRVSYDATWNDSRRSYFSSPIYYDIQATFKIYYLILPIYQIDDKSGIIDNLNVAFDNNKFGIITSNGFQRATYLPQVFSNISWDKIKKSISNKAGIGNSDQTFYAYHAIIDKMKIMDYYVNPILNFINSYSGDFIPYSIINKTPITDKSQSIRNIGTIYDLLCMEDYGYLLKPNIKEMFSKNITYYTNSKISYQAMSFLILAKLKLKNVDRLDKMVLDLENYLSNNESIDQNFEIFEILISLIKSNISQINLDAYLRKFYDEEIERISVDKNDIFRFNWMSKFLQACNENTTNELLVPLSKKIAGMVKEHYQKYHNDFETNYLAVMFECITALHTIISEEVEHKLTDILADLIKSLESRRADIGLFKFIDGEIRLDITGHVLNGYYNLCK